MGADTPTLWLIAGPNGVGKTSYARRYLRAVAGTERFVNLDEIARGYSPLTPTPDAETATKAARSVLHHIADHISHRRSFALETTLAGRTHLRTLAAARAAGFATRLVFCILPDVETALSRIAARVTAGGHAVPEADARRRFPRACANFSQYAAACDLWRVLDTQMAEPRLVAAGPPPAIADAALLAGLPDALRAQLAA
ncbi:AAA family ATPase [Falsiroseomonas sp. E2-1-a20]|uniref:AAA family ATPase n=1 Tax=Falsiroseomonas sp. E2-1-a20 TaxID=3239300 RepID=UPI003F2F980F